MASKARLTRTQRDIIEESLVEDPDVSWAELGRRTGVRDRNDRSEAGHWELGLVIGARNRSALLNGIERRYRFGTIVTLQKGDLAEPVLVVQCELFDQVPVHLRMSVTFDQGSQMAHWSHWQATTAWTCTFATRVCRQCGAIENYNGHTQVWFPRGSELASVDAAEANGLATLLDCRRRRVLDWDSPERRWVQVTVCPRTPG